MPRVRSFAPLANAQARVLILGSMPGIASLQARQYYAHPQNLFWRIAGEITGCAATASYATRVRALKAGGIAVWDVLESCAREGSLDSAIDDSSVKPNDFASFYRTHGKIAHVFFNGAKAEQSYRKWVLPLLEEGFGPSKLARMPSTSPAHASMPFANKKTEWTNALRLALRLH